jgi:hypothetical protein
VSAGKFTFGRQHLEDGWIRFVPRKTLHRRKTISEEPILMDLETGSGCVAMKQACTAHGLRKIGAAIAAESGATEQQLMAFSNG